MEIPKAIGFRVVIQGGKNCSMERETKEENEETQYKREEKGALIERSP